VHGAQSASLYALRPQRQRGYLSIVLQAAHITASANQCVIAPDMTQPTTAFVMSAPLLPLSYGQPHLQRAKNSRA
jgi:hypothetical protein